MVCAGYQKKGMVFLKTKFHCTRQFIPCMISPIGIGVNKPRRVPPVARMCVSVILCRVMKTGAKIVFIVTEMAKASSTFSIVRGQHLFHREGAGHQFFRMRHTQVAGKGRYAGGEDHKSHVDAHAEDAPHHGTGP